MAGYNKHSDEALTDLLKEDNHAAFTEIYNRYWKFLFNAAYNVNRNKEDSIDVCQAVFLWIWENRQEIKITGSLKGYLYTAVKYKIANLIRNGKYRKNLFERLEKLDVQTYQDNEMEIKELQSFIDQLINELPDRCREVFVLSRSGHLSHKQIAQQLGIAEKTVDAHITKALKILRSPLEKLASIFLMF